MNRHLKKISHLVLVDTDAGLTGKTVKSITDERGNTWLVDWQNVNGKGTRLSMRIHRDNNADSIKAGDTVTGTLTITLTDGTNTTPVDPVPVDYVDDVAPC